MKKVKLSLMALALAIGVTGAFAFTTHQKTDDPVYNWNNGQFIGTVIDAQDNFDCHGATVTCASGVLVSGQGPATAEIFENE